MNKKKERIRKNKQEKEYERKEKNRKEKERTKKCFSIKERRWKENPIICLTDITLYIYIPTYKYNNKYYGAQILLNKKQNNKIK